MGRKEYFIVQKCGYDDLCGKPPQDYLGLFAQRVEAEKVAYYSAQQYAQQQQAVVQCIDFEGVKAFCTAGDLFWVRPVPVVADLEHTHGAHFDSLEGAHAIMTAGVIGAQSGVVGWAGNRNGSIDHTGVVFVGPTSHAKALHYLQYSDIAAGSKTVFIPFAPLPNALQGWFGENAVFNEHESADSLKRRSCRSDTGVSEVSHDSLERQIKRRRLATEHTRHDWGHVISSKFSSA